MRMLVGLILRAVALAMGVATLVRAYASSLTGREAIVMLALGLVALALASLEQFTRGMKLVQTPPPDSENPQ